jgi:FlaG/FlaF family flagellin (archaellin)
VLAPAALGAGTVVKSGGTITWTGDGGVNNVTLTHAAGVYTFTRGGSDTMSAGAGCSGGATVVSCSDSAPAVTAIALTALGGADLVVADSTTTIPITILGGDGDDHSPAAAATTGSPTPRTSRTRAAGAAPGPTC